MRLAAAIAVASALSGGAFAEEAHWYTRIDNDVAFGTDRWYTSGLRIARVKDDIEWGLEQDIYTPDANKWHPGLDDRAPAARLLASVALHDRRPGVFQTIELAAGVRGAAALGRQTTNLIHHVISAPHVDWSRQGENHFDGRVAAVRSQSIGFEALKAHVGATLGTQVTFAHAGIELRAGDPTLSSALLRFAPTPPTSAAGATGWGGYAGASIRAVARNNLISRNYDAFGADIEARRTASRFALGVEWSAAWGGVSLDIAQDSKEFDAQTSPQRFGSLTIHLAF